eukprot:gnl/TRDRNA2_/TRDRNA2_180183_c0_seq1.p1 gnl/TRDRNA2_/TRDRNA2_180183_c0~~gnl/TRDRNA2_/TRDRNA2_180183_c0_seq1.p1  ORF type:complete len:313 (+),score=39.44 gnl/TRDRNA2_/TRDRNA2_180183_c0_seq1:142-1080(+)
MGVVGSPVGSPRIEPQGKRASAIPSLRLGAIEEAQADADTLAPLPSSRLKVEFADFWGDEEADGAPSPRRYNDVNKYAISTPRLQIISMATPRAPEAPSAPAPTKTFVPPWPYSSQWPFCRAPTTLELRNLPRDFSTQLLVAQLDAWGYAGRYNFVHVPTDPRTGRCLGFGLVNAERHADGCPIASSLHGCKTWSGSQGSRKGCAVSWSFTNQGFDDLLASYQQDPTAAWVNGAADGSYIGPWLLWEGNWTTMPMPTQVVYRTYDEMGAMECMGDPWVETMGTGCAWTMESMDCPGAFGAGTGEAFHSEMLG